MKNSTQMSLRLLLILFLIVGGFTIKGKIVFGIGVEMIPDIATDGTITNNGTVPTSGCRISGGAPGDYELYFYPVGGAYNNYPPDGLTSGLWQSGGTADNCQSVVGGNNLETIFSGSGNGSYFVLFGATNVSYLPTDWSYYYKADRIGGLWYNANGIPDINTRIISHSPDNNEVLNPATPPFSATSTNPVAVSVDIYFNDTTLPTLDRVCLYMEPMETEMNYSPVTVCKPILASAGSTIVFDAQILSHGRYFALVYFSQGDGIHYGTVPFEFINQYTLVQNQSCAFGDYVNGTCPTAQAPNGYASTTPVAFNGIPLDDCSLESDLPTKALCAIGNTLKNTVNFLFIPDTFVFQEFTNSIHDDMLTHFPLGYITDFVDIMGTTTTGTLVVLEATVPNNMIGAGSSITLDLNHGLDTYLNATSGAFKSGNATSTETIFEFTNRYWTYMVYIGAFLYIVRRIFGWWKGNEEIT